MAMTTWMRWWAMVEPLAVLLNGVRVGTVRSESGRMAFDYVDDPVQRISVSMPTSRRTHGVRIADAWFRGLLPDNDRVLERWGHAAGVNPRSPMALLGAHGADVAGALQLCTEARVDEVRERPARLTGLTEVDIGEVLRAENADDSMWPVRRWSLGGAQAKLAVTRTRGQGTRGQDWAEPSGSAASTHIIKPGIPGFADQALNEHLCLNAARAVGHVAARSEYHEFDGVSAIVVERFDRYPDAEGLITRLHQEDMCQALGVPPSKKYQSDGGPGAPAIAALLREHESSGRGVERFASAVVLQALLGAPDAHARNYALLLQGDRVLLAPLYDIASTLPYEPGARSGLSRTAMTIGGRSRFGEIQDRHVARFAETIGVEPDWLVEDVRRQAHALPDAISDAARDVGYRRARMVSDQIIGGMRTVTLRNWIAGGSGDGGGEVPDAGESERVVQVRSHTRGGRDIGDYTRSWPRRDQG